MTSRARSYAPALGRAAVQLKLNRTHTANTTMSAFEDDHNPFRTDTDVAHTEDGDFPSTNNGVPDLKNGTEDVDAEAAELPLDSDSEASTPPAHPARIPSSPPLSPGMARGFGSPPATSPRQAFRPPQPTFKSDFCCARDRWLHSGEDVEIQVGPVLSFYQLCKSLKPYLADRIRGIGC